MLDRLLAKIFVLIGWLMGNAGTASAEMNDWFRPKADMPAKAASILIEDIPNAHLLGEKEHRKQQGATKSNVGL